TRKSPLGSLSNSASRFLLPRFVRTPALTDLKFRGRRACAVLSARYQLNSEKRFTSCFYKICHINKSPNARAGSSAFACRRACCVRITTRITAKFSERSNRQRRRRREFAVHRVTNRARDRLFAATCASAARVCAGGWRSARQRSNFASMAVRFDSSAAAAEACGESASKALLVDRRIVERSRNAVRIASAV